MKAFGLELRKQGSFNNLYSDVDLVLQKSNFMEVQRMTVAHSLQNMMKPDKWFCICAIDDCIKVCEVHVPSERYNVYRALHCVHWRDMLPDFRTTLIAYILDDFRSVLNPTQ